MATKKFDELDRKTVIRELEKALDVELRPVGRRRKYLEDQSGRRYLLFGGYGEWHGFSQKIADQEVEYGRADSLLVVVRRFGDSLEVSIGPLVALIKNREKLHKTQAAEFNFNVQLRGGISFFLSNSFKYNGPGSISI